MNHKVEGETTLGRGMPRILHHTYSFRTRSEWLPKEFQKKFTGYTMETFQPYTFFGIPFVTYLEHIEIDIDPYSTLRNTAYTYTLHLRAEEVLN
jgi:hypothetical protein